MKPFAKVKILKQSISWTGIPVTTFLLEYPRYIHAELLTHRVFSKNSASSRAIPFSKFLEMVKKNPVIPIWTENQKGMQGPVIEDVEIIQAANEKWLECRDVVSEYASWIDKYGIHKQNVNRLLEPWMHIRIILTGTDFSNWFELRDHKDAHPEIRSLASLMKMAMENYKPVFLQPGEYHIPFGDEWNEDTLREMIPEECPLEEMQKYMSYLKLKIATARCARISYNTFEGDIDYKKDVSLFDKLIVSKPVHASPTEHIARVPYPGEMRNGYLDYCWEVDKGESTDEAKCVLLRGKYFSNLTGWVQLRKMIESGDFK